MNKFLLILLLLVLSTPLLAHDSGFWVEGGYGGGAFLMNTGYQREIVDDIKWFSGIGYGIGNQYGVGVVDLRVTVPREGIFGGIGVCYALYSERVADIPGISGTLPSKNLVGAELLAGARMENRTYQIGYNTALGIRASAGYEF